jgi:hypothetical protein
MAKLGTIDVNDLTKTVTAHVSITGYKKYKVKLCVGKFLIWLGIRIIGMNAEIEIKE